MAEVLMILTCMWEVPSLNVCLNTDYPNCRFHGCPQSFQVNRVIAQQVGLQSLTPISFTVHYSTIILQHIMSYSS